jgi:hypothetical protein
VALAVVIDGIDLASLTKSTAKLYLRPLHNISIGHEPPIIIVNDVMGKWNTVALRRAELITQ